MRIKGRLVSAIATLIFALLVILGALILSVKTYRDSLDTVTADRVVPLRQIFVISRELTRINEAVTDFVANVADSQNTADRISLSLEEIGAQWRRYKETYLTPEEGALAGMADSDLVALRLSVARLTAMVSQVDRIGAALEHAESFQPLILDFQKQLDALVDLQQRVAGEISSGARDQVTLSMQITIAAGILGILAIAYALYIVRRFIISPLGEAQRALTDLASGRLAPSVPVAEAEEMAGLLGKISETRDKLADIAREESTVRQRADEFSAQLEAVFKYAPYGILIKDLQGRFVALNDAEARLWGMPREACIGRASESFLPPDEAAKARETDQRVLETGEPHSIEYRGHGGCSYEWLQTVKFPVRDRQGQIIAIAAFDFDISEDKRRLQEVETAAFQLRRSIDIAGMHYWFWRRDAATGQERISYDGTLLPIPPGGYDIAAEYDRFLRNRIHPDDQQAVEPVYRDFVAGKIHSYELEYCFRRADGSWIPLKVWTERVIDERSGDIEIHVISLDISDTRAREEELIAAKLRAEVADRAKTDFLANMSHELRTPLNPILGFSELLQMKLAGLADADAIGYLGLIHEGGKTLLRNINIILEYAQIDVVDTPLEEFELSLRELIDTSIAGVKDSHRAGGIDFVTMLEAEGDCLLAEERTLRRALSNILSNAAQHAPADSVVTILTETRGVEEFAISVIDQGPGFTPDLLQRVGKAFVRGGDAMHYQYGGIGLGLTITIKLMALHNGRLEVENQAGGGARVSLIFPASRLVSSGTVSRVQQTRIH